MRSAKSTKKEEGSLPESEAAEVLRKFRQIFNAVKNHFQQVEKKVGVGGAQVWALSLIEQNPGIGISKLSTLMDIHQSTASNLIKLLLNSELVSIQKSEIDKRIAELFVSPKGKRLLKKAPAPFSGVLPHALLQLNPKALGRLNSDLTELLNLIQVDESAAKIPLADL